MTQGKHTEKTRVRSSAVQRQLPEFCDYSCAYAEFPPADAVGACRREQAVYCSLVKKFSSKNARCLLNKGQPHH